MAWAPQHDPFTRDVKKAPLPACKNNEWDFNMFKNFSFEGVVLSSTFRRNVKRA